MSAIEISIDVYPRNESDIARALLLGTMQRTYWTDRDIWKISDSQPRFVFGRKGSTTTGNKSSGNSVDEKICPSPLKNQSERIPKSSELYTSPTIDSTVYFGAQTDDIMIRIMDKVLDKQRFDGSRKELTGKEKRVRIEVSLKESSLNDVDITDIASLGSINFPRLQKKYFQFMLPAFAEKRTGGTHRKSIENFFEREKAQTYLKAGVIGLGLMISESKKKIERPDGHRSVNARRNTDRHALPIVSWSEMNEKVRISLRSLGKREQTAARKGVST